MVTHLELGILEYEVKWALGSITLNKASGSDGIPAELSKILKYDAVKVLHSVCQQIWKTRQWPQDWKISVFIPVPRREMPKNVQIIVLLHSFHMLLIDHALEKEMATHSSVLAWSTPGIGEPGGLPSMGSHRVGHD